MPNQYKQPFYLKEMFDNSLHFRYETKEADIDTFLDVIGGYNEFNPTKVKQMLKLMDSYLPRYKGADGNPNNGSKRYKVSIGRAGSPVIYLNLFATGSDHDELVASVKDVEPVLKKIAYDVGVADEFSVDYNEIRGNGLHITQIEIRVWWD